jgi:acyl-CoA thioesterase
VSDTEPADATHPFAALLGFEITECSDGNSIAVLPFHPKLDNPNKVIHGGAIYSLADTGMGAAVFSLLEKDETCATIEIKMTYLSPGGNADLLCESMVLKKGRRVAMVESGVYSDGKLIAKASGSFAIFSS